MFVSNWVFILEAKNEKNAKIVMNRIFKQFNQQPSFIQYSFYQKDDFNGLKVSVKFEHGIENWDELVIEIIGLGQGLGVGWYLSGDIFQLPTAVLSKENSHIKIVGLYWASWEINRHE
ncbi:hypothetical protein HG534_01510 [Moraxella osloensis]|nr:hypothetical protein [Moraxella osloensis]MBW4014982.1 hypothetical protein [Moraxella osloensis]